MCNIWGSSNMRFVEGEKLQGLVWTCENFCGRYGIGINFLRRARSLIESRKSQVEEVDPI